MNLNIDQLEGTGGLRPYWDLGGTQDTLGHSKRHGADPLMGSSGQPRPSQAEKKHPSIGYVLCLASLGQPAQ